LAEQRQAANAHWSLFHCLDRKLKNPLTAMGIALPNPAYFSRKEKTEERPPLWVCRRSGRVGWRPP
jgi:hypothetical protein